MDLGLDHNACCSTFRQNCSPDQHSQAKAGSSTAVPDISIEVDDVDIAVSTRAGMGIEITTTPSLIEAVGRTSVSMSTDPAGKLLDILAHQ